MAGQPVGYLREETKPLSQDSAGGWVTSAEMRLVLNRMGSRIELRFLSSTEESSDGGLRHVRYEMLASNQATSAEAVVKNGSIEVRTETGGKAYSRTLTYSGILLGPEGIRRLSVAQLKKPGDKMAVQTYVAEASLVGRLTRTLLSREKLSLRDQSVDSLKVEEELEGLPVKRTGWLDGEGILLKQQEPGPFGEIEVSRAEKSVALDAAGGEELPAEIFRSSIVRSNVRLPRGRPIERLKLKLIHRNPSLGWPDLETAGQKVISKNEKELILEIRRIEPARGQEFPVTSTEETREYLEPNSLIQSDDPEIRRLARELTVSEKDAFQAGLRLERWVAEEMIFDLGIVFAPATEVFRDRRGTCVGYATLLATVARAAGIPSRISMGYVYALGMFGGHAWTEIRVGERWIPLDAAIVNDGAADACRLSIVNSSLAEGPGGLSLGAAQQLLGQVDIEILEFESGGLKTVVRPGAEPFVISGDRYENPWLAIGFAKPADFKFGRLDAVWPDRTLVEILRPRGEKAVLEQHEVYPWEEATKAVHDKLAKMIPGGKEEALSLSGKKIILIADTAGRQAAGAVIRGLEVLILRVEGKDARQLLRQLLESLRTELLPGKDL